jgi:hypothetical protein
MRDRWARVTARGSLLGSLRAGPGRRVALLLGLPVALVLLATVATSAAAFSSTSTRSGAFVADVLNPPTDLGATRTCLSPTFRSNTVGGSTSTSASIDRPPGLAAGDVMVAWGVTGGTVAITAPSGWAELQEIQTGNATMRASVFWKRAGTSEPSSYTFNWEVSGLVSISAYRGVDGTTAIDGSGISGTNSKGTSTTTPVLTTSVAQTRLLHNLWVQNVSSVSGPSLKVRRAVAVPAGTMLMLDEARPTAGTADTRTFSWSTSQYSAVSAVALRPADGNASSISLVWTATPDTYATGYEVSRNGGAQTAVSGRTTTSYTDTAVSDTTSYSYAVRSVFGSWRSSAPSVSVGTC